MRRGSLNDEFIDDPNLPHLEEPETGYTAKSSLSGIVIDDAEAKLTGKWTKGAGLKGYIEDGYQYIGNAQGGNISEARFEFTVPKDGEYEVRIAFQPHENRSTKTPVTVISAAGEKTQRVNQKIAPPLAKGFYGLGAFRFKTGEKGAVVITNEGIDGNAHIDAVQVLPLD
jgi:hypothetical protein